MIECKGTKLEITDLASYCEGDAIASHRTWGQFRYPLAKVRAHTECDIPHAHWTRYDPTPEVRRANAEVCKAIRDRSAGDQSAWLMWDLKRFLWTHIGEEAVVSSHSRIGLPVVIGAIYCRLTRDKSMEDVVCTAPTAESYLPVRAGCYPGTGMLAAKITILANGETWDYSRMKDEAIAAQRGGKGLSNPDQTAFNIHSEDGCMWGGLRGILVSTRESTLLDDWDVCELTTDVRRALEIQLTKAEDAAIEYPSESDVFWIQASLVRFLARCHGQDVIVTDELGMTYRLTVAVIRSEQGDVTIACMVPGEDRSVVLLETIPYWWEECRGKTSGVFPSTVALVEGAGTWTWRDAQDWFWKIAGPGEEEGFFWVEEEPEKA